MDGWMDGRMDGWMDGWMWMDGRISGKSRANPIKFYTTKDKFSNTL
jgi:hypothetical protein